MVARALARPISRRVVEHVQLPVRSLVYSVPEVAEIFHVSTRTVHRWITAGDLPALMVGGKRVVRIVDVEAILESAS